MGEIFSCTLCANNELLEGAERVITGVKIGAEMQTPSGSVPLELTPAEEEPIRHVLEPRESLQKTVRFDLQEEGNHVLAVSLGYSETIMSKERSASSGRVRTFRKLYQFAAQPCLGVRTKISEFPRQPDGGKNVPPKPTRFTLEAQLENMADGPIMLEQVTFDTKGPFQATSLNWDAPAPDGKRNEPPNMIPRDVMQVAFLIEEQQQQGTVSLTQRDVKDGRTVLGQLSIRWRTAMGDSGFLTTGWLMTKKG